MKSIFIGGEAVQIASKWEVCPRCEGAGHHGNPTFDGANLSEFDGEFLDEYFSGEYDVACIECNGRSTISVNDLSSLTCEQAKTYDLERQQEADDRYTEWLNYRSENGICC